MTERAQTKRPYTKFYYLMLIISTIGAGAGIYDLFTLPAAVDLLDEHRLFAILRIITLVGVFPVAFLSLILLWRKHPDGIKLRVATYVITAIIAVTSSFHAPTEPIDQATASSYAELQKQNFNISEPQVREIVSATYYGAFWSIAGVSALLAVAWIHAWKRQQIADQKK